MSEIAHIEKRLDSHASEIKEIRSLLSAIPGQIHSGIQQAVRQAIEAVGGRRSTDVVTKKDGNGIDGKSILVWIMALLALCGTIASFWVPMNNRLNRLDQTELIDVRGSIDKLDTVLQREMRLLNDRQDAMANSAREFTFKEIERLEGYVVQHQTIDGHPHAIKLHAESKSHIDNLKNEQEKTNQRLENAIRMLDDSLQREMRDLDASSKIEIKNLDTMLQREIAQAEKLVSSKMDPIITQLRAAEADLASRKGKRFNMPDYHRLIEPQLKELKERIKDHEKEHGIARQENFFTQNRVGDAIPRLDEKVKVLQNKVDMQKGGGN